MIDNSKLKKLDWIEIERFSALVGSSREHRLGHSGTRQGHMETLPSAAAEEIWWSVWRQKVRVDTCQWRRARRNLGSLLMGGCPHFDNDSFVASQEWKICRCFTSFSISAPSRLGWIRNCPAIWRAEHCSWIYKKQGFYRSFEVWKVGRPEECLQISYLTSSVKKILMGSIWSTVGLHVTRSGQHFENPSESDLWTAFHQGHHPYQAEVGYPLVAGARRVP